MWESVGKHMKNFKFKNTVHLKYVKGTFIFNDMSRKVITSLKMQQSWFLSYMFFFSSIISAYWEKTFLQMA